MALATVASFPERSVNRFRSKGVKCRHSVGKGQFPDGWTHPLYIHNRAADGYFMSSLRGRPLLPLLPLLGRTDPHVPHLISTHTATHPHSPHLHHHLHHRVAAAALLKFNKQLHTWRPPCEAPGSAGCGRSITCSCSESAIAPHPHEGGRRRAALTPRLTLGTCAPLLSIVIRKEARQGHPFLLSPNLRTDPVPRR